MTFSLKCFHHVNNTEIKISMKRKRESGRAVVTAAAIKIIKSREVHTEKMLLAY